MHQRRDHRPQKYQDRTDAGNRSDNRVHHHRGYVEEKPGAAEDDRLHRVKTHKAVPFFQQIKNNSADEWDASNRSRDVRWQV